MKNLTTLRNHLFDQLERLAQANTKEEVDMEVQKASAVVEISDQLLKSATVEAAVIQSVKTLHSAFIPDIMQEVQVKQIEREKEPYKFNSAPFNNDK